MTYNEFKESFQPMASLGFSAEKLPGAMEVYYKALKDLDGICFREACLRIAEKDDITINGKFPSPNRFRFICSEVWKEQHSYSIDKRIGNRPQDIKAQAEFYETVRKLAMKHGNAAPEGFVTPLHGAYLNCVGNLKRMEHYHQTHHADSPDVAASKAAVKSAMEAA